MRLARHCRTAICSVLLVAATLAPRVAAAIPAFPGAEGFGAAATGGRGGQVLRVTTLGQSGPGSLREALETAGPRTIVFTVSGVIDLGDANADDPFDESDTNNVLTIAYGDVTIAGQTAPGAGITIRGRLYTAYDESVGNVIVRHLRIRPGPFLGGDGGEQYDGLRFAINQRGIFDHVSVSHGVDENVDVYEGREVTMQWSTIEEAATEGHPEGDHNYGLLNYGGSASVHHNLFAHNRNRNPALATGPSESINNVAYNVRHGFVNHNDASGEITIVGNTFIQGPDDTLIPLFFDGGESVSYWLADNAVDDPGEFVGSIDDPWSDPYFSEYIGASDAVRAAQPFVFAGQDYVPITTDPSQSAYDAVLACAGAFPRDVVTSTAVQEVIDRGGSWGGDLPADLLEGLVPGEAPADEDADGMADAWELRNGLDPTDGSDHATVQPSGYTAIETYINELADGIACGSPPGDTDTDTGADTSGEPGTDSDPSAGEASATDPSSSASGASASVSGADASASGSATTPTGGTDDGATSGTAGSDGDGGSCGCANDRRASSTLLLVLGVLLRRRRR